MQKTAQRATTGVALGSCITSLMKEPQPRSVREIGIKVESAAPCAPAGLPTPPSHQLRIRQVPKCLQVQIKQLQRHEGALVGGACTPGDGWADGSYTAAVISPCPSHAWWQRTERDTAKACWACRACCGPCGTKSKSKSCTVSLAVPGYRLCARVRANQCSQRCCSATAAKSGGMGCGGCDTWPASVRGATAAYRKRGHPAIATGRGGALTAARAARNEPTDACTDQLRVRVAAAAAAHTHTPLHTGPHLPAWRRRAWPWRAAPPLSPACA